MALGKDSDYANIVLKKKVKDAIVLIVNDANVPLSTVCSRVLEMALNDGTIERVANDPETLKGYLSRLGARRKIKDDKGNTKKKSKSRNREVKRL